MLKENMEPKNKRILIIGSETDKHLGLFSDIENRNDVVVHYVTFKAVPLLSKVLRRIHLKLLINKKRMPYRYLWYNYKPNIPIDDIDVVLVINGAIDKIKFNYIKKYRKVGKPVCLYLLDSVDANSFVMRYNRKLIFKSIWDSVYSYDYSDAKKYKFEYLGFCYYSMDKRIRIPSNPKYDLFFAGNTKGGRYDIIHHIFQYVLDSGANPIFEIQLQNNQEKKKVGPHYNSKWISYQEVIMGVANSKCVLEIVQQNQSGPSLRYFEAVCYNKKLITNNPHITVFPYYNPNWMKIINSAEDIDVEWLVKNENIDYHYKGDFSPNELVNYFIKK